MVSAMVIFLQNYLHISKKSSTFAPFFQMVHSTGPNGKSFAVLAHR